MEKVILIIAAMEDVELDDLKAKLKNKKETKYCGFSFFEGELVGRKVVLCASKVGLIHSAVATTIAIENYQPAVIINQGLAGGYTKEIKRGEIVVGTDSICITSMEDTNARTNTLEDYELTTFRHGEEHKLIPEKANEEIVEKIRKNFASRALHFRKNRKRRYLE